MFLWEQGKFTHFLQLIARHDKASYPSYFEAAMGMPLERIVPLWQSYLRNVAARRNKIMTLPPSTVFKSEETFQSFAKFYDISLEQVKKRD